MMDRICLGLALPLLLGAVQDDLPPKWKLVESTAGRFKISMPENHAERKQPVKTAKGMLEVVMLVAEGRNDVLFVVSYSDYPAADLKADSVEKRLDYARDGAVHSAGGKLRSEKSIKLDTNPGRDIVIEKDGDVVVRMRIYLAKNRLYQVMTLGNAATKEHATFLESFRLIK